MGWNDLATSVPFNLGLGLLSQQPGAPMGQGLLSGMQNYQRAQALAQQQKQQQMQAQMNQQKHQQQQRAAQAEQMWVNAISQGDWETANKIDPVGTQKYRNNIAQPSERGIVKGADGYSYYKDTKERVLPDVEKPEKEGSDFAKALKAYNETSDKPLKAHEFRKQHWLGNAKKAIYNDKGDLIYSEGDVQPKGKILSSSMVNVVSEASQLPDVIKPVKKLLQEKTHLFGPVKGAIGGANPYAKESQKAQSDLKIAAQVIGKFMEGGVLRKEDEIKYAKMLPNLKDHEEVAKYKMEAVDNMLLAKHKQYLKDYGAAGYDVSGFFGDEVDKAGEEETQNQLNKEIKFLGFE